MQGQSTKNVINCNPVVTSAFNHARLLREFRLRTLSISRRIHFHICNENLTTFNTKLESHCELNSASSWSRNSRNPCNPRASRRWLLDCRGKKCEHRHINYILSTAGSYSECCVEIGPVGSLGGEMNSNNCTQATYARVA